MSRRRVACAKCGKVIIAPFFVPADEPRWCLGCLGVDDADTHKTMIGLANKYPEPPQ